MTTKPDEQAGVLDSLAPIAIDPKQAVDQVQGSPDLPEVTVLERDKSGLRATTLGEAIDSALESDPRRYNVAHFLRIAGIWANDLHSRMEDMGVTIKRLREENRQLAEQLATKREEIGGLRGAERTKTKHKPLIAVSLIGGPMLFEIGLHLISHNDLGMGSAVAIIGVVVAGAAIYVALDGLGSHG